MASFFADIQNWFSAGFYGRHLGVILQELGKRQPEALASFISASCGIPKSTLKHARFQAEVTFAGSRGWRRADLGIFLEDEEEPAILVEIKYFDKPLPETATKAAQFSDYLHWKEDGKDRHVLVLSREIHRADGLILRRWDALARHLRPYAVKSDLIGMLVEYLEEEGIVMQNVHGNSLMKYFKRLLCHNWKSGVLANNIEGPAQFTRLMKNLRLMSGTFDWHFKRAWNEAGLKVEGEARSLKIASIDFQVQHEMKPEKGARTLVDEQGFLNSDMRDGGSILVYATHSLGHGATEFLRIEYGMRFEISSVDNVEDPPLLYLYARAYGREIFRSGLDISCSKKINYAWVTDRAEISIARIEERLHCLLQQTVGDLLDARLPLQAKQKKSLEILRKSLGGIEVPKLRLPEAA